MCSFLFLKIIPPYCWVETLHYLKSWPLQSGRYNKQKLLICREETLHYLQLFTPCRGESCTINKYCLLRRETLHFLLFSPPPPIRVETLHYLKLWSLQTSGRYKQILLLCREDTLHYLQLFTPLERGNPGGCRINLMALSLYQHHHKIPGCTSNTNQRM